MPKETCLCGVNATTATKVFAWIFLVLKLLIFFANLGYLFEFMEEERENWLVSGVLFGMLLDLIAIFCVVLLLFGTYKKQPGFYWPFLVYSIFMVVMFCIPIILYVVLVFFALFDQDYKMEDYTRGIVLFAIVFVIFAPLHAYLGFVVPNKSRKMLLDERYKALLGY